MGPLTVAPWGKWCGGFGWSGLNEAGTGVMFSGRNQVPSVDGAQSIFSLSLPSEFSPGWSFSVWLAFFLHLDGVSQCSLLDATYGLSFSKGLSALGLEPHLLLLLLHKHRGSWHVQRVSALPLTLLLCYILAREI